MFLYSTWKSEPAHESKVAVMPFSYAQMAHIVNVLADVERNAQTWQYPLDKLEANREIVENLISRLTLLEKAEGV